MPTAVQGPCGERAMVHRSLKCTIGGVCTTGPFALPVYWLTTTWLLGFNSQLLPLYCYGGAYFSENCSRVCRLRTVLIEQFFFPQIFLFLFTIKTGKAGKTGTFLTFENVIEGEIFGRLRIPICGEKRGKYGNTKNCAKKNVEI